MQLMDGLCIVFLVSCILHAACAQVAVVFDWKAQVSSLLERCGISSGSLKLYH